MKWKCRDGRVLDIREMDTQHLKNAIAMVRRKGAVTPEEWDAHFSRMPQGDMAQMAWENEAMRLVPYKPLVEMEAELRKRKHG